MRLDVFLKKSALIKRRVVAKELIEKEKVLVNKKTVKPSFEVTDNDLVTLKLGEKIVCVKVIIERRNNKEFPKFEVVPAYKMDIEWLN